MSTEDNPQTPDQRVPAKPRLLSRWVIIGAAAVVLSAGAAVTAGATGIVPVSDEVTSAAAHGETDVAPSGIPAGVPSANLPATVPVPTKLPSAGVPTKLPVPAGTPKAWDCKEAAGRAAATLEKVLEGVTASTSCDGATLHATATIARAGVAAISITVDIVPGVEPGSSCSQADRCVDTPAGPVGVSGVSRLKLVRADGLSISVSAQVSGTVPSGLPNVLPSGVPGTPQLPELGSLQGLLTELGARM
ncbi:hypothetical protein [Longispora albida]|uniref:hypothetical protein n=1 Tax=Longispora albida TaxID=203523 RepID=UPI00036C60E2|nr:hypothetical protein [Longispora albida]